MIRIFNIGAVVLLFLALVTSMAFSATLRGKVICENGAIKRPIEILIEGKSKKKTIKTDYQGNYVIVIPVGKYQFTINTQKIDVLVYQENAPKYFYIQCD